MKEKLYKTKKELEIEYMLNSKEIKKLNEKIKVLNTNLIEGKFWIFTKSFVISLLIFLFSTPFILSIAPNILVNIIGTNPLYIIRYLFIGPIIPGIIAERTASIVNHKKLNRFSGAKTDEQKREEILECELQKQKLNDKNEAINVAYDFASDLETRLDVCNLDFGNSNMSKEEQEKNNKNLRENIKAKEKELEILSTQHFLNNNFVMLRTKLGKLGTIGTPFMAGLLSYLGVSAGALIIEPVLLASPVFGTIGLIGGTIGTVISSVPTYLRNKQNRKIFNKFNNKLGEDKLPENVDSEIKEVRKIVSKGNKVINELATAHLVYQDSTRELENISSEIVASEETALDIAIRGAKNLDDKFDLRVEPDKRMETIMRVAHEDKDDISWVQPYLEEDIKEDVVDSSIEGPTLVKRK